MHKVGAYNASAHQIEGILNECNDQKIARAWNIQFMLHSLGSDSALHHFSPCETVEIIVAKHEVRLFPVIFNEKMHMLSFT